MGLLGSGAESVLYRCGPAHSLTRGTQDPIVLRWPGGHPSLLPCLLQAGTAPGPGCPALHCHLCYPGLSQTSGPGQVHLMPSWSGPRNHEVAKEVGAWRCRDPQQSGRSGVCTTPRCCCPLAPLRPSRQAQPGPSCPSLKRTGPTSSFL